MQTLWVFQANLPLYRDVWQKEILVYGRNPQRLF